MADDSQSAQTLSASQSQQDPAKLFRSMPLERQKTLLGKMSQQQKNSLYTRLKGGQATPAAAPPSKPSFRQQLDSFLQSSHEYVKTNKGAYFGQETQKTASAPERFMRGVAGAYTGTAEFMLDALRDPMETEKRLHKQSIVEFNKSKDSYHAGNYLEAIGHGLAGVIPGIGPYAAGIGEQVGRGDFAGAAGQAAGIASMPHVTEEASRASFDMIDRGMKGLETRAAALDTKALQMSKERTSLKESISSGHRLAAEHIWGQLKNLPEIIEKVRGEKEGQISQLTAKADAAGVTINVAQDYQQILNEVNQWAATRGRMTPELVKEVNSFTKQLTTKFDPQTKQFVPRDLTKLKPSEAVDLTRHDGLLSNKAKYTDTRPDVINNLARRFAKVTNDGLGKKAPGIVKLRGQESDLITARESAVKLRASALNGKSQMGRGMLYTTGGLMLYGGLRALGLGSMALPLIATVATYKTLASVASRTLRASLMQLAVDTWDGGIKRMQGQGGAQAGSAGGSGFGPQSGPQGIVKQGVTGGPGGSSTGGASGPAAPVADATIVSTSAPPTRGTLLTDKATRARAGSGDYVKGEEVKTEAKPAKQKVNVAESNTKTKAMMDRLDVILNTKAKSGAHYNALQREAGEIKRMLSGEASRSEASASNKRIADRERLASKRSEAAASQTGVKTSSTGEVVSSGASPDARMILLEQGYAALAKFENGKEFVKALKQQAKDAQRAGIKDFDEVEQLTTALHALRAVADMPKD